MMNNNNVRTEPSSALLKLYRGTNLGRAKLAASGPRICHKEQCSRKHKPILHSNPTRSDTRQIKTNIRDHVNDANGNIEALPQTSPIKQFLTSLSLKVSDTVNV